MLTYAEARSRLAAMVQGEPVLTAAEIDTLVTVALVGGSARAWKPNESRDLGQKIVPSANGNGHVYEVTVAGVSGGTEPTWPTAAGGTVADGTATLKEVPADYDLSQAAAMGWAWKAGKVAANISLGASGAHLEKQQVFDHCLQMQKHYAFGGGSGVGRVQLMRSDVRS